MSSIYVVNLTFWKLGASLHNIYCVNKWIASITRKEHNVFILKNSVKLYALPGAAIQNYRTFKGKMTCVQTLNRLMIKWDLSRLFILLKQLCLC